ncbi:UNVERIFIED_CONTAM: hypothetical protein RMT77_008694 [Armadillidium vulgare]
MMLSLIKRVVCRYKLKFSYRLCLKYYCKKVEYFDMPSALYAGLETKGKIFSTLDPYLDISSTFCDMEKLKTDLQKRKIDYDIDSLDSLLQQSVLYEKMNELLKGIKENIERLKKSKDIIDKENADDERMILDLNEKIAEANEALSAANEELRILEKTFIVPFLQIPNSLHKNTTEKNECLFSLFSKPEFSFPVKSHVEIGKENDELFLKDVSPSSYYLKGKLAQLELAVSEFMMSRFQEHDFRSYANVDTARAVLAEGCGIVIKNNNDNLRIDDPDCLAFNQVQFLFGSSSLTSFVSLFCKGLVEFTKPIPIRLVTTGRKYKPRQNKTDKNSLFSAIQSSSVSAFVVYPLECSDEAIVNEIAMLMSQTYTELGLHFTLIQYGASKLEPFESLAVGLCLYSPFSKSYIEVGRISLCQDFISKRLQIYQNLGKKRAAFLGMIYVEIMDIKNWIGCLMENTQSPDGKYSIPKCLEKFFVK